MTMIYTTNGKEIGLLEDIKAGIIKDLSGASLQCTDLQFANLGGANMRGADLRGADLQYAFLSGADLSYAKLRNCIGNKREIKSLQLDMYNIAYTHDRLQIGCENHSIEEWFKFDDERIDRMDVGALEWWQENKDYIKLTLVKYPAKKP